MENQNEVITQKSGNGSLIIIIVLALLVGLLGGYILNDKLSDKKQTDNPPQNTNTNNQTNTTNNTQLETFDISKFDGSKIINKTGETTYDSNATEATNSQKSVRKEFIKAELQNNSKSVIASIDWNEMNLNESSKDYTYTISNFDKNIRKVYVSGFGQATGSETILYLMEDGTVEYTPITYNIVKEAVNSPDTVNLKSYGKIQNVEGVVMIATVSAHEGISGYKALIGIKADGSFYELSSILNKTAEYISQY